MPGTSKGMIGKQGPLKMVMTTMIIICGTLPMILFALKIEEMQRQIMSPDKFGPITARLMNVTQCKGPKRKNCSKNTKIETADQSAHKYRNMTFTLHFDTPTPLARSRIAIWRINNDSLPIPDVSKVIDKPCNEFFLAPLLKKYMKVSPPRCLVAKGTYVSNINGEQILDELLGFRFFYGAYESESVMVSANCNVFCLAVSFVLDPKVVEKPKKI